MQPNKCAVTDLLSHIRTEKVEKADKTSLASSFEVNRAKEAYKSAPALQIALTNAFTKFLDDFLKNYPTDSPKKEKIIFFQANFNWEAIEYDFIEKVAKKWTTIPYLIQSVKESQKAQ